jgi:hypothetical protein
MQQCGFELRSWNIELLPATDTMVQCCEEMLLPDRPEFKYVCKQPAYLLLTFSAGPSFPSCAVPVHVCTGMAQQTTVSCSFLRFNHRLPVLGI